MGVTAYKEKLMSVEVLYENLVKQKTKNKK